MTKVLIADYGPAYWPFVRDRLEARVRDFATPAYINLRDQPLALDGVDALAFFGLRLDEHQLTGATNLRVVGGVFDHAVPELLQLLTEQHIPLVDVTQAWAPSVAETGLALMLCGLRRIAWWHHHVIVGDPRWPESQFCDEPSLVNGDLGTKTVGVVGLGAIGSRIAEWCGALGASVLAFDPYAPAERFAKARARRVEVDELVDAAEILVIAVPPTPTATGLIDADRIARLRPGAWVVSVTRVAALDTAALRARVLNGEVGWASDVWDVEPLPPDDPLIGHPNVVHLPHIAGRTRDANLRVADLLADDLRAVLEGREPRCAVTARQVEVRTAAAP